MTSTSRAPSSRVALIGCGRWGRNIARALASLGALEIIADAHAEAVADFARELGVDVTGDIAAVIADPEITAVAIAAPAVLHAELALKALKAGKHVFVEKPLALNPKDAARVATEAEQRGLTLMVGHLLQYHPAYVRLLDLVAQGAIGELRHISSNRLNPGAIRVEENALWSMAPHDFSMILALAGRKPQTVHALAVGVVDPAIPDQFAVQLKFAGRLTAQTTVSWLSPFKEHKLVALGTKGALVFEDTAADPARKLVLYPDYVDLSGGAPAFRKSAGEPVEYPAQEPLKAEMQWFLDCVAGGKTPRTGPVEAMAVLELLCEATRAAGLAVEGEA